MQALAPAPEPPWLPPDPEGSALSAATRTERRTAHIDQTLERAEQVPDKAVSEALHAADRSESLLLRGRSSSA
jgi:hypothetical protein